MIHSIPWYIVLLVSIPEMFLALLVTFKIYNIHISVKKIFSLAVLSGIAAYFVRMLPLYYGLHTIALVVILAGSIYLMHKINLIHSLIIVVSGTVVIGITQALLSPIILMFSPLGFGEIEANPMLNFYFFVPSAILMVILYLIVRKYKFTLYDLKI